MAKGVGGISGARDLPETFPEILFWKPKNKGNDGYVKGALQNRAAPVSATPLTHCDSVFDSHPPNRAACRLSDSVPPGGQGFMEIENRRGTAGHGMTARPAVHLRGVP